MHPPVRTAGMLCNYNINREVHGTDIKQSPLSTPTVPGGPTVARRRAGVEALRLSIAEVWKLIA